MARKQMPSIHKLRKRTSTDFIERLKPPPEFDEKRCRYCGVNLITKLFIIFVSSFITGLGLCAAGLISGVQESCNFLWFALGLMKLFSSAVAVASLFKQRQWLAHLHLAMTILQTMVAIVVSFLMVLLLLIYHKSIEWPQGEHEMNVGSDRILQKIEDGARQIGVHPLTMLGILYSIVLIMIVQFVSELFAILRFRGYLVAKRDFDEDNRKKRHDVSYGTTSVSSYDYATMESSTAASMRSSAVSASSMSRQGASARRSRRKKTW